MNWFRRKTNSLAESESPNRKQVRKIRKKAEGLTKGNLWPTASAIARGRTLNPAKVEYAHKHPVLSAHQKHLQNQTKGIRGI